MISLGAVFGQGQNFGALFGHEDGVFELGGETAIFGSDGPVIAFVENGEAGFLVDHRFDGEAEAGEKAFLA